MQGATYRLQDDVAVSYYLPLPRRYRCRNGDYALTNDGRFFSKMDFPHRSKQLRVLRTVIVVSERDGGFDLDMSLAESAAPFTIELCFRRGGSLTGVQAIGSADDYQLVDGVGTYTVG